MCKMCKMCASTRGQTQHGSHNYAIIQKHYKDLKLVEEKDGMLSISLALNSHTPLRKKSN